ncbi:hypothetical protein QIS99_07465 [Streptomyces sp. B-S-A8]|uniref:Uncharacterized protein n=1 Tax=Streptomyces solicavernae TaxID=3043614 RepID=A0ABT6RNQ5_9ACTN|nr:hypothetical protein [Streptomyces sp. B-S-A8]MDI3386056.1 hypothetical protein [Streptomyces sp. B-S-A8]
MTDIRPPGCDTAQHQVRGEAVGRVEAVRSAVRVSGAAPRHGVGRTGRRPYCETGLTGM